MINNLIEELEKLDRYNPHFVFSHNHITGRIIELKHKSGSYIKFEDLQKIINKYKGK